MFGRGYISTISSVDGQAAFLREEARFDHIAKLRSVSTRRAPGLPQKLPLNRTMSLLNDPKLNELHRRLCELKAQGATEKEINAANRQFRIHRQWSKRTALEKWKEEWLDDHYQRTIQSGGTVSHDSSSSDHRIQALFRVMSERARLAEMIASDKIVTRDQTLLAVQDLLSLCQRDFEVMYRPGDEPVDQSCPVCHTQLPSKASDRPDHIYGCRRNVLRRTWTDVNYCFLCYHWFRDALDWETHCSKHLLSMTPVWCGVQTYCHTIIRPGMCPFCLCNEQLSASNRLRMWTRNYQLMTYVDCHINEFCDSRFTCPHPLCDAQENSIDLFRHHLSDTHGLTKSQREAFDAQRSADMGKSDLSLTNNDVNPPPNSTMRRKKRKPNSRTEPIFIAWSPPPSMLSRKCSSQPKVANVNPESKRKFSERRMQLSTLEDYSSNAFSTLEEKLQSDDDTVCDSLSDLCPALRRNDSHSPSNLIPNETLNDSGRESVVRAASAFECIRIPIDPALLSADDHLVSHTSIEASEENAVLETPHASFDTIDEVPYQISSNASAILMHDIAKGPIAKVPWENSSSTSTIIDHDSSVPNEKGRREKSFSISRCAPDECESPSASHPTISSDLAFRCPICNRDVARPRYNKPMNARS